MTEEITTIRLGWVEVENGAFVDWEEAEEAFGFLDVGGEVAVGEEHGELFEVCHVLYLVLGEVVILLIFQLREYVI